jgi:hypothetical protein
MTSNKYDTPAEQAELDRFASELATALNAGAGSSAWSVEPSKSFYAGVSAELVGESVRIELLNVERTRTRWTFKAAWDRDLANHISFQSGIPEITVARAKSAPQIAAELRRRLLPDVRSLTDKARASLLRHAESERRQQTVFDRIFIAGRGWLKDRTPANAKGAQDKLGTDHRDCNLFVDFDCMPDSVSLGRSHSMPVELAELFAKAVADYCDARQDTATHA